MDTTDSRSNLNLPAPLLAPLGRLSGSTPAISADPSETSAMKIDSKIILRAIGRHWWRILTLWLIVSAPIGLVIYMLVLPTYEAFSLLRIEPAQPEIFGPLRKEMLLILRARRI